MPHGETAGVQQEEYGDRRTGRKEVADEHRDLFVPAVAQRAGENAQQDVRRVGTDREQRRAERGTALPVCPDDKREARHAAAECGKRLRGPQQQKRAQRTQGGKLCFEFLHDDFAPYSKFLFRECKVCGRSLAPCGPVRDQTLHGALTMQRIMACPPFEPFESDFSLLSVYHGAQ